MPRILSAQLRERYLRPPSKRTDVIQSFVVQETALLALVDDEACKGTGYTCTIGADGSSIMAMPRDHLPPRQLGRSADSIETIWRDLLFSVHAHFLMKLHAPLACAVSNGAWLEHIPRLAPITRGARDSRRAGGPSSRPGLGIAWDWDASCQLLVGDEVRLGSPATRRQHRRHKHTSRTAATRYAGPRRGRQW